MATQIGNYSVLNKAKINLADGTVTIVVQVVEISSNRVVVDNLPTNLVNAVKNNLQAVAGQYDIIGA